MDSVFPNFITYFPRPTFKINFHEPDGVQSAQVSQTSNCPFYHLLYIVLYLTLSQDFALITCFPLKIINNSHLSLLSALKVSIQIPRIQQTNWSDLAAQPKRGIRESTTTPCYKTFLGIFMPSVLQVVKTPKQDSHPRSRAVRDCGRTKMGSFSETDTLSWSRYSIDIDGTRRYIVVFTRAFSLLDLIRSKGV
jgi:hypothetical protein